MEIGDIVRLKSGSPPLTVTAVTPVPGSYSVEVTWIDDARRVSIARCCQSKH